MCTWIRRVIAATAGRAVLSVIVVSIGAVVLSGMAAASAQAAPGKRKPATELPTECVATATTPGAEPRARYVWTQLRLAGYSPAASAGVVGALDAQSALAPMAMTTDSSRFGIAQWPIDRWQAHIADAEANRWNRWSLRSQTIFLIAELAANPGTLDSAAFMTETDPAEAAERFLERFVPTPADAAAVAAAKGKAAQWLTTLESVPLETLDPALANGIPVECLPVNVTVDRCPMVPASYKRSFASFTGFSWDRLGGNTQRVSRCVYTNFPYIASQGTYLGHKPNWSLALDLFMPRGCTTRFGRRYTTSSTDKIVGDRLAKYLLVNARRLGVDYVIWQDHIRNPGEHGGENLWRSVGFWRQDNYNNGNCTNTHFDHVHISTYPGVMAASTSLGARFRNPDGKPW